MVSVGALAQELQETKREVGLLLGVMRQPSAAT